MNKNNPPRGFGGFWMVQHQLYATMPKYVLRMAGEGASPSWYANVNPFVVVITVGFVTSLMRRKSALFSMTTGMFIMPVSALAMATGNLIHGNVDLGFMSVHPIKRTITGKLTRSRAGSTRRRKPGLQVLASSSSENTPIRRN